jgi:hypothetical protein
MQSLVEFSPHVATQGKHVALRGTARRGVFDPKGLVKDGNCVRHGVILGALVIDGSGERLGPLNKTREGHTQILKPTK